MCAASHRRPLAAAPPDSLPAGVMADTKDGVWPNCCTYEVTVALATKAVGCCVSLFAWKRLIVKL